MVKVHQQIMQMGFFHCKDNYRNQNRKRAEIMIIFKERIGYIMILIAGILWGSIGFFVSIFKDLGAESTSIAFLRIGVGAVLLIPLMFSMGGIRIFKIDKRGLIICLILGIIYQAAFNFFYNEAIDNVGTATASVMLYTSPVFVCVMSRIFFKEDFGVVKLIALVFNVFGCILVVTGGEFTAIKFSLYGVNAGIIAGFLYALMTIISKTTTENYNSLTIIFYSFVFGAIALAIITRPWENIMQVANGKFILVAIGYGLIPTVGAFFFYMKGLSKKLEISKVPVVASIETVVASIIGIFIFSESSGLFKVLGIGCVIISIAIMNIVKQKKEINGTLIQNNILGDAVKKLELVEGKESDSSDEVATKAGYAT